MRCRLPRKQARKHLRQAGNIAANNRCLPDPLQARCQAALVLTIAAQVQQAVFPDQRRLFRRRVVIHSTGYPLRCRQLCNPLFGHRPFHAGIHQPLRLGRIKAGVALRYRQRRQGCCRQHRIRRVRIQAAQALRQGMIQRAQRTGFVQCGQQAHASPPSRANKAAWPSRPPANNSSTACTSSAAKLCAYRPGDGVRAASRPRQNR